MDSKLDNLYNGICRMNKELFSKDFITRAIVINEDYNIGIVFLPFKDDTEKAFQKIALKKLVLSEKRLGYVFISDIHVTILNKESGETEVKSGLLNALFTPSGSKVRISIYDKEYKFTEDIEMDDADGNSDWNVWNMAEHDEEMERKYQEFKKKNSELYDDKM